VGGVLEPPQARPVVVEDGAFIGGLCGIFEGIVIRKNAVLAPGLILSKSTRIYDLVFGKEWEGEVPESAVVVPGARPARGGFALERGLSLQAPIIVKYRDEGTAASVTLESALR
jgi:2,3,4,5-tetrahydropyridine-2-carboxylate N-succinyltransferase